MLSIQPTLFGGVSLIRNWGRIGTTGQTMVQTFDASAEAGEAFVRLERAKRRRGYTSAEEKVSGFVDLPGIWKKSASGRPAASDAATDGGRES